MALVAQEIINLIDGCEVDERIVESIINDATTYVSNMLSSCDGLSDSEIEMVTKWFAAHMVASGPHRDTKKEKLMEGEVEFITYAGEGIESTPYGRMAVALDRCGKLKNSGKRAIKIRAITSFD